ncbi:hypothetical protein KY084_02885 [Stakelama sp. CBK3Z-3]|uniref:Glycerophosphoryl diester phosphodiesterase membrane domain-containing protein n=1 Tax=Stakelama flava TaxID=2860338 RepID=A0ABS6XK64_9SPHN|nr:hypothetical protein [Stakelama flava]MBW4329820.1 hypothetical protein [Stakelama flava]
MKMDIAAIFADAGALWRARRDLILRIAPPFLFLPPFAGALLSPEPAQVQVDAAADPAAAQAAMIDVLVSAIPVYLITLAIGAIGTAALYRLLLRPDATVGQTLRIALPRAFFLFLAMLAVQFGFFIGLILLIVPGVYFYGRSFVTGPVLIAENVNNPVEAITRSFALTRGNGWTLAFAGIGILFGANALVLVIGDLRALAGDGSLVTAVLYAAAAAVSMFGTIAEILLRVASYRRLGAPIRGI